MPFWPRPWQLLRGSRLAVPDHEADSVSFPLNDTTMPAEEAVEWVSLESTVLRAVRYFEQKELLYLEFNSGAVHRYFDFPVHQYRDLLAADSHGKYFNQRIRNRFREERVRPPTPAK